MDSPEVQRFTEKLTSITLGATSKQVLTEGVRLKESKVIADDHLVLLSGNTQTNFMSFEFGRSFETQTAERQQGEELARVDFQVSKVQNVYILK